MKYETKQFVKLLTISIKCTEISMNDKLDNQQILEIAKEIYYCIPTLSSLIEFKYYVYQNYSINL